MNIPINIFIKHIINNIEFTDNLFVNFCDFVSLNNNTIYKFNSVNELLKELHSSNKFTNEFKSLIHSQYKSLLEYENKNYNAFTNFIEFHFKINNSSIIPDESGIICNAYNDVPFYNLIKDETNKVVNLVSWKEYYMKYLFKWNNLHLYEKAVYMIANWKLLKRKDASIENMNSEFIEFYTEKWYELSDKEKSIWSKPKNVNPYLNWISIYKDIVLQKHQYLEDINLYKFMGNIWRNIKNDICYIELYKYDYTGLPYTIYDDFQINNSHTHNLELLIDYLK
jgi:hypothetical protein